MRNLGKNIFFKNRIREPKLMHAIEMKAFEILSKENYKRWVLPLIEEFVSKTSLKKGFIIDVACGPGFLSKGLGKKSNAYHIVGIDISRDALKLARKNCKNIPNVSFKRGSVYRLPFLDGKADAVICKDSFHHFDRPSSAIMEMLRIVKQGGYVLIQDMRRDLPQYLIKRVVPRASVIQKLQYYSTRAAYTKHEMRAMLKKLKIRFVYLSTRQVSLQMAKHYKTKGINPTQLKEGLQARYNLLIRK